MSTVLFFLLAYDVTFLTSGKILSNYNNKSMLNNIVKVIDKEYLFVKGCASIKTRTFCFLFPSLNVECSRLTISNKDSFAIMKTHLALTHPISLVAEHNLTI